MPHIAVFFAEGFEEIEALAVVDLARRAEIKTDMVSVTGNEQVTGSHGIPVLTDMQFESVDFAAIDMIVLPGGMPGTKNLEAYEPLMEQVRAFHAAKRDIAAICAAPGILGRMGMLTDRKAVSHPSVATDLAGAEVLQKDVVTDGHLTTSRGMGTAVPFALKIVERFCGKDKARLLAQGIVYGY